MNAVEAFQRDNPHSSKQYTPGTPCYRVPRDMDWNEWRGKMATVVTLLFETCREQEEKIRRSASQARV